MKRLLLFALTAVACLAYDGRFRNLRSNRDGSLLYFIADARLSGSDHPFHAKVFAASANGVETILSFPRTADPGPTPEPFAVSNFEVSADGETMAYSLYAECDPVQPCLIFTRTRTIIRKRSGQILWQGEGTARLSPNGRYAMLFQSNAIFRLDLTTLVRKLIIAPAARATIANNGTIFAHFSRPMGHLFHEGEWETIPADPEAVLSGDGSTLLLRPPAGVSFVARNLSSGAEVVVPGSPVTINENGTRVLTRFTDPQTRQSDWRVFDTLTQRAFLIPEPTEPVSEYLLTPDGNTVFFAHGTAIVRHNVETGSSSPAIVYPIRVSAPGAVAVPGSLTTISVFDVFRPEPVSASPPLPLTLGGFKVFVEERQAPIRSITTGGGWTYIQIQVPWETDPSNNRVVVRVESSQPTPFESIHAPELPPNSTEQRASRRQPSLIFRDNTPEVRAVHQDLDRPITVEDPARRGEVVHFFVTGLGRVNREVATGAASPSEPPARPLESLVCLGLPVLDTVLAPGQAGVYRATVAVPQGAVDFLSINCEGSNGFIPVERRP